MEYSIPAVGSVNYRGIISSPGSPGACLGDWLWLERERERERLKMDQNFFSHCSATIIRQSLHKVKDLMITLQSHMPFYNSDD